MNEQDKIDLEIEKLHQILSEDVDNHYQPGKECLSDNHHFELWDEMMELKRELQEMKKAGS